MEILIYVFAAFAMPLLVLAVMMLLDSRTDRKRRLIKRDHSDVARIRQEILEGRMR